MTIENRRFWENFSVLNNRNQCAEDVLDSELLNLMHTSDVNNIPESQIQDAQEVLKKRTLLLQNNTLKADKKIALEKEITSIQRGIVKRYLKGRRAYYNEEQCAAFDETADLLKEGRDTFLIIKFMDEAPHIKATITSMLRQKGIDLKRVTIIASDNNSTDGSSEIILDVIKENRTDARIIHVNQSTPGGGSAARYGVDRTIASIYKMCETDGNWERLKNCIIGVSDGDTVYHPQVVNSLRNLFDSNLDVDGVMPFLVYKFTAALRFFKQYRPLNPLELRSHAKKNDAGVTKILIDLSDISAFDQFPRKQRKRVNDNIVLSQKDDEKLVLPLDAIDCDGRKFAVIRDPNGSYAYVIEDGTIVLDDAPVSGVDAALVFQEANRIQKDQKWRWHAVIGHDLFLMWIFQKMGIPEGIIQPDTSDALKMFRCWSFSIGGQHQLSNPHLKIVTGTDYQSGRIHQSVGCKIVLGPSEAYAETEVDRLAKMVRNFAQEKSVFYGETRSRGLDRASGLYLHMTKIQNQVEAEIREYTEEFFRDVVFPERVLFPLRWLIQNALTQFAYGDPLCKKEVYRSVFQNIFSEQTLSVMKQGPISDGTLAELQALPYDLLKNRAEDYAEDIIESHYADIMAFYKRSLRSFFETQEVATSDYEWLLEGVEDCRNALREKRPKVEVSDVWSGKEFTINQERGQVVEMATVE